MRTTTATPGASSIESVTGRLVPIVRDIARGGLAGLLTGFLVAGIGGRLVMRAAALAMPAATGRFTENGNAIGEITAGGTFALLVGGTFVGLMGAVLWTVVSPWLPGGPRTRALLAAGCAVALTGVALVQGSNPDFQILRHDRLTVGLLMLLVACAGLSISLFDSWLERRLPPAGSSSSSDAAYFLLTVLGAGLVLPPVVAACLGQELALGLAIATIGAVTLVGWAFRYKAVPAPSWLQPAARAALLVTVVLGFFALGPNVIRAAGLGE